MPAGYTARGGGSTQQVVRRLSLRSFLLVTGAIGLAACSSSPSSSPSTSTTAIAPAAALATGSYLPPGAGGTPHYVVKVDSAHGAAFRGVMSFVYQDGTSSRAFDLSGIVSGQRATAMPSNLAATGSGTPIVSSVPASIQIGIASDVLTFNGCQVYLPQVQSASGCRFTLSR